MIDRLTVFEIHRLAHEGYGLRKIARHLNLCRKTVKKYFLEPDRPRISHPRPSKIDPFKETIKHLLDEDPTLSAALIHQRISQAGFSGGYTIVKDHLRLIRAQSTYKRPFIRFESPPGEQCQIDWGHFGSIAYGNTNRKLYCFALVEAHSRLVYLEFTHSQRQEALHRALLNAFDFMNGTPRQIVVDNMLTAVTERDGSIIRFNGAFLDFLRPFAIVPRAANPGKPHEKGKIESVIGYIRRNFFPARTFAGLDDLQAQADSWRDQVANTRTHTTTGEKPIERFKPQAMRPLPDSLPDCRDFSPAKVHSDFAVRFDSNFYTVPPWAVGKSVVIKADHNTLTVYLKDKPIAQHSRSWERKRRVEIDAHVDQARKYHRSLWRSPEAAAFVSLGEPAKNYLEKLIDARQPLRKSLKKLLSLLYHYGQEPFIEALGCAAAHRAYAASYIENILFQNAKPRHRHPPVTLRDQKLNLIRLQRPSLADYDAIILKNRHKKQERP